MNTRKKQITKHTLKWVFYSIIITVFFVPSMIMFDPIDGVWFTNDWKTKFMEQFEKLWFVGVIASIATCILLACIDYHRKYHDRNKKAAKKAQKTINKQKYTEWKNNDSVANEEKDT